MSRVSVAVVLCLSLSAFAGLTASGCREEPTIVIKFEPSDMTGGNKVADLGGHPAAADLASGPDLAPVVTSGKPAAAECKTAADCTVLPDDCCACTSGGKQHAVPKKKLAALEAARKKSCGHTMCPMIVSHDPSCAEEAGCVAGACTLVARKTK